MKMDDRLSRALKSLPRERAAAGFTTAVLARLDERPRRPAWPARPLAVAAAVLLVALATAALSWRHLETERDVARLEALRSEKLALETELARLERLAREARPVIYLGGTSDLDLVLDVGRLRQRRPAGALPASADSPGSPRAVRPARLDPRPVVF